MDEDTATEILEATYRALCRYGYAELTLENIAEEADRSKGIIHYHYDNKENLFVELLDFLYERYTTQLPSVEGGTPRAQLSALLDVVLTDEETTPDQEIRTALLEVKAQAPYNDAIQTRLTNFDEVLFERIQDIIAAGVEIGEFDTTVEPAVAAEFLVTIITGAHTRCVAVECSSEQLHETITRYVEKHLIAEELSEAPH
ncbi:TetR/AcrR family transcriptional regulator (plasmid) [Haloplanus ruber]|jgi:TetR/AcrR family transcriptional repressor of nem operon|uniref:TetR/AcrR family transcriptional regulator n=1 Tax=Haloplanus ruber TaxID=869892 RepID=A0ABD6D3Y1_9EURY|nr:TetR/AcrR family transcriptional regulator [Haloplanus ruber]